MLNQTEENNIINLYQSGISCNKISKITGHTRKTIKSKLIKNNIEILHNDFYNRKYYHNSEYFTEITDENCYWAGFVAADGNIYSKLNRLLICLSIIDENHLLKFKNCIEAEELIKRYNFKSNKKLCQICIIDKKILVDLYRNFNIIPNKTLILQPPNLKNKSHIINFIRGYLDGDGCIYIQNNFKSCTVSFTGTYDMMKWIQDMLTIFVDNIGTPKIYKTGNVYKLAYGGINQNLKILTLLYKYDSVKMDRKYNKFIEIYNYKNNLDKKEILSGN